MKLRFPIYARTICLLVLNLLVLAAMAAIFFRAQFRQGFDSMFLASAGRRFDAAARLILSEIQDQPREQWNAVLRRFGEAYEVEWYLYRGNGIQLAGETLNLPDEVQRHLRRPMEGLPGGGRFAERMEPPPNQPSPEDRPDFRQRRMQFNRFFERSRNPDNYWFGIRLPIGDQPGPGRGPVVLLARSDSLFGGGLLLDPRPWIYLILGMLAVSILFWIVPVRSLTRSIGGMIRATDRIAEGRFDTRVPEVRRDELGRLGETINQMAARLEGYVTGQKRFLGDIAHELCAPIARIQVALGIIEQRADERQREYVNDLNAEIQHMSSLVNELLSFSRATLGGHSVELKELEARGAVGEVIDRERAEGSKLVNEVGNEVCVLAEPDLLKRALGNLIRNAIRYAGTKGPVRVTATTEGRLVVLSVIDCGPGVPESDLPRLTEPFYRVDTARTHGTGGTGLGLAIVKTCIESCNGQLRLRNRAEGGFEAGLILRRDLEE